MGSTTTSGIISGAIGGAATGSTIGPWGTVAGAVIGGVMGGVKGNQAEKAQDAVSSTDAGELARLAELRRTVKQLETGTDPLTKLNIRENQRSVRSAQHGIARVTGGDVGATISAMQKAQMTAQTGNNRAIAEAAKRIPYFDNAVGGLTSRIADRKLQLQLLKRSQKTAESAQYQTDANVSGNALLGAIGGGLNLAGTNNNNVTSQESLGVNQQQQQQSTLPGFNYGYTQGFPNSSFLGANTNNQSNLGQQSIPGQFNSNF